MNRLLQQGLGIEFCHSCLKGVCIVFHRFVMSTFEKFIHAASCIAGWCVFVHAAYDLVHFNVKFSSMILLESSSELFLFKLMAATFQVNGAELIAQYANKHKRVQHRVLVIS